MKYTSAILVLSKYFSVFLYFTFGTEVTAMNTNEHRNFDKNIVKNGCNINENGFVAYKIALHTYWSREIFPKHYPDWKPPAQWSKTLGRTHDASFNLFSIGKVATSGIKMFAETGRSDDLEAQSTTGTFDDFSAPPIFSGSGYNEANFFADINHTLVSFITKITPSPDWFVGVDSFQLCVNDSWIDKTRIELHPLDAGTDNGFTFTAPDWPTEPTGVIYHITSGYPAHQAGSFFYPQIKQLPPIATATLIKLKEYQLIKTFHNPDEDARFDPMTLASLLTDRPISFIQNNELSANIEEERQTEEKSNHPQSNEKDRKRSKLLAKINRTINSSNNYANNTVPNNITETKKNSLLKQRFSQPSKDCRVGNWSEWSPCSKSCGIGEMQRYRKIIRHAKYGGRSCPPLKEAKWCALERDCISDYY